MIRYLFFIFLLNSFFVNCNKDNAITKENWYHHPEITEIRMLQSEIQANILNKKLISFQKTEQSQVLPNTLVHTIYEDSSYHIRKYFTGKNVKEIKVTTAYFYDVTEVLRQIHRISTNSKGQHFDEIIYFGKNGNKIWEIQDGNENLLKEKIQLIEIKNPKEFFDRI